MSSREGEFHEAMLNLCGLALREWYFRATMVLHVVSERGGWQLLRSCSWVTPQRKTLFYQKGTVIAKRSLLKQSPSSE